MSHVCFPDCFVRSLCFLLHDSPPLAWLCPIGTAFQAFHKPHSLPRSASSKLNHPHLSLGSTFLEPHPVLDTLSGPIAAFYAHAKLNIYSGLQFRYSSSFCVYWWPFVRALEGWMDWYDVIRRAMRRNGVLLRGASAWKMNDWFTDRLGTTDQAQDAYV